MANEREPRMVEVDISDVQAYLTHVRQILGVNEGEATRLILLAFILEHSAVGVRGSHKSTSPATDWRANIAQIPESDFVLGLGNRLRDDLRLACKLLETTDAHTAATDVDRLDVFWRSRSAATNRGYGIAKGLLVVPPDFDDPLPPDMQAFFE